MSDLPDGGPAYPRIANLSVEKMDGMTLRDYFAGQVLAGISASPERLQALAEIACVQGQEARQVSAAVAYQYADAMLEEREKARR